MLSSNGGMCGQAAAAFFHKIVKETDQKRPKQQNKTHTHIIDHISV